MLIYNPTNNACSYSPSNKLFLSILHLHVLYTSNIYSCRKASLKYSLITVCLFLPLLPFPPLRLSFLFTSFITVSCSTFTVYCNKHNQHFTVAHNTHPSVVLQIFIGHITCRESVHFHYFPKRHSIDFILTFLPYILYYMYIEQNVTKTA